MIYGKRINGVNCVIVDGAIIQLNSLAFYYDSFRARYEIVKRLGLPIQ